MTTQKIFKKLTYFRRTVAVLIPLIAAVTLFLCFRNKVEFHVGLAKEAFCKGDYEGCRRCLGEASKRLAPDRAKLYRAYLARAEGDLELSSSLLESALEMARSEECSEVALEVVLNLAFNSYLQGDQQSLLDWSVAANQIEPDRSWARFVSAMAAYSSGEFKKCADLLDNTREDRLSLDWLSCAFGRQWSTTWRRFCRAHCAMECDDLVQARELLNQEPRESLSEEELQWQTFLMGLTYAHQAELKSLEGSVPYYRLAQSYFDQLPEVPSRFLREQRRLERQWALAANRFLGAGRIGEATYLSRLLEEWHSSEQIAQLASKMSEQLIAGAGIPERQSELTSHLNLLLCDGELREEIATRLAQELSRAISEDRTALLPLLWEMAITLSKEPALLSAHVATHLAAQISLEVAEDDLQLSRTRVLLEVWNKTARDRNQALNLARVLVAQSPYLAANSDQLDKARQVIEIAAALPQTEEDREVIRQEISESLVLLRASAQSMNDAAGMLTWEQLGDRLGLVIADGSDVGDVANLLADADYLYRAGRYPEALERAILVRRADPLSREANRLVGLCCYRLGRYQEAVALLSNPPQKGCDAREALAISLIESESRKEGVALLESLAAASALSDRSYLLLAAARIEEGALGEAHHWLNSLREPCEAGYLLRLYAEGVEGRWPEVWRAYRNLSQESQAIPEVNALLALGYIEQDKVGLARKAVAMALKGGTTKEPILHLLQTDPHWAAAHLAYRVDQDRAAALHALEQIDHPTVESLLFEGEIRLEVGDLQGAERALLLAQRESPRSDTAHLLSRAWQQMGLIEDAALATLDNAELLRSVGRFDLTLAPGEVLEPSEKDRKALFTSYFPPQSSDALVAARLEWQRRPDRLSPLMKYARLSLFSTPPQADRELLEALTSAAKRCNQLPELFYLVGKAQQLEGLSPLESYETAVSLYPDFVLAWQELAQLRTGHQAIEALEQIVRILPGDVAAWDRLGDWYLSHGNVDLANQCWDRSYRTLNAE